MHASTPDQSTEAEAVIVVTTGMLASVQIAPFLTGDAPAVDIAAIDVAFFDNTRCAALPLLHLPAPVRPVRTIATSDGVAEFDLISTVLAHAVTGRARDRRNVVQAQGCVDLPGTSLVAGDLVRVPLPLVDASPSPVGQFDVTSQVTFAGVPATAALAAAPWIDLQDCPLDPAQLWLDCTLDALSGAVDGDPIDCQPQPGREGPLGALLLARRGVPLPGADGAPSACRGSRDAGGAPSHDALLASLFGTPKPASLVDLHDIATQAGHIFGAVALRSRLQIADAPGPDTFTATHTFISAAFGAGAGTAPAVVVDLLPLGLPALRAPYIRATASGRVLAIDQHRITLRLGTVARAGFGQLALASRGLPADSLGALRTLLDLAATPLPMRVEQPHAESGCAALDAVLCADVGQARGCLMAACNDGVTALAARLDAGFALADGEGLDLIIDGATAPIIDSHASGAADRLGNLAAVPPAPGAWTATLRTRAGDERLIASWDAFRSGN